LERLIRANISHALLIGVLLAGLGTATALADGNTTTVPASAASPVPLALATAVPTPSLIEEKHPRVEYSLTGTQTWFDGSRNPPNTPPGTLRLGWDIGYYLTPKWELRYNRGNLDYQLGQQLVESKGKVKVSNPALAEDFIDEIGARYILSPDAFIGAGHYRRWHQCCPASGADDNDNPAVENTFYLEAQDSFGWKSIIGRTFTIYMLGEMGGHQINPAELATVKPGELVPPATLPVMKYLDFYIRFPVWHQKKVVPYLRLSETGTDFNSTIVPNYSDYVMEGLDIYGSPAFSYQVNSRNYHGHNQGGTTSIYTWLQASMTYHGKF
jgi:hypothetical protein